MCEDAVIEIDCKRLHRYFSLVNPFMWVPRLGRWWYRIYLERMVYRLEQDFIVQEREVVFLLEKESAVLGHP